MLLHTCATLSFLIAFASWNFRLFVSLAIISSWDLWKRTLITSESSRHCIILSTWWSRFSTAMMILCFSSISFSKSLIDQMKILTRNEKSNLSILYLINIFISSSSVESIASMLILSFVPTFLLVNSWFPFRAEKLWEDMTGIFLSIWFN